MDRKVKVYLDTSVISHLMQEVTDVARQIIDMGILAEKSFDDCQHG